MPPELLEQDDSEDVNPGDRDRLLPPQSPVDPDVGRRLLAVARSDRVRGKHGTTFGGKVKSPIPKKPSKPPKKETLLPPEDDSSEDEIEKSDAEEGAASEEVKALVGEDQHGSQEKIQESDKTNKAALLAGGSLEEPNGAGKNEQEEVEEPSDDLLQEEKSTSVFDTLGLRKNRENLDGLKRRREEQSPEAGSEQAQGVDKQLGSDVEGNDEEEEAKNVLEQENNSELKRVKIDASEENNKSDGDVSGGENNSDVVEESLLRPVQEVLGDECEEEDDGGAAPKAKAKAKAKASAKAKAKPKGKGKGEITSMPSMKEKPKARPLPFQFGKMEDKLATHVNAKLAKIEAEKREENPLAIDATLLDKSAKVEEGVRGVKRVTQKRRGLQSDEAGVHPHQKRQKKRLKMKSAADGAAVGKKLGPRTQKATKTNAANIASVPRILNPFNNPKATPEYLREKRWRPDDSWKFFQKPLRNCLWQSLFEAHEVHPDCITQSQLRCMGHIESRVYADYILFLRDFERFVFRMRENEKAWKWFKFLQEDPKYRLKEWPSMFIMKQLYCLLQ